MAKERNYLKFDFVDNTNKDLYNESVEMTKSWYGEVNDGQVLDIETYYNYCKQFAAAMGFTEKTINEWFGDY